MDDQTNRPAPRHVVEALDASVRDVAEGRVHETLSTKAEARRMIADHESTGATKSLPRRDLTVRRTRSTS